MKTKIIFMSIITAITSLFGCNAQNVGFKSMEVDEFDKEIAGADVILVDVRTPEEYLAGHIEGARNIDVLNDDFEKKACAQLPKGKTIAVYCRSGKRSKKAAGILAKNGYKIIELNTGYLGWTGAGKDVVKEQLTGSFTEYRALETSEKELFEATYKGETELTPMKVATQVVAGTNYSFLCRNSEGKEYVVVIYQPLPGQGEAKVSSVKPFGA